MVARVCVGSPIWCLRRASEISSMSLKNEQWKEKSRSWSLKLTLTVRERSKPIFGAHETLCVNNMEQRRKLQKMCLTYRLYAMLHRFMFHQRKTSYPHASPPSRHCSYPNASLPSRHYAYPNPKHVQGPLRSQNILSSQKIHNISLHTNAFHSNLDRVYTVLYPSS